MKTKQEFLNEFFNRLSKFGFQISVVNESDIVAEVFSNDILFCVITQDGEIVYENYDESKSRELTKAIAKAQKDMHISMKPPFDKEQAGENINLTRGAYSKMMEGMDIVLLCRYNGIFGYEFITCQKAHGEYNSKKYYREQGFHRQQEAQLSFANRSGIELKEVSVFNDDEMRLLLSCCNRNLLLDNDIDTELEIDIKNLMGKIESYLPIGEEYLPKQYFERENE